MAVGTGHKQQGANAGATALVPKLRSPALLLNAVLTPALVRVPHLSERALLLLAFAAAGLGVLLPSEGTEPPLALAAAGGLIPERGEGIAGGEGVDVALAAAERVADPLLELVPAPALGQALALAGAPVVVGSGVLPAVVALALILHNGEDEGGLRSFVLASHFHLQPVFPANEFEFEEVDLF